MISRTIFCSPGAGDPLGAHGADAGHLAQAVGLRLDHVEHFLAERLDHLPGVDRADAADHPGTEIFLDAFGGCRRRRAQEARLELLAMGAVVDPFARRGDPLAGGDRGGVPHGSHQFAMPPRLDADYAEAIFGVVERDPFDEARQNFLCR